MLRRRPVALLALPLLAALALAGPGRAAPADLTPVAGQLQQAFRAAPYDGPAAGVPVTFANFFFTGTPQDQANKVAGNGTATFAAEEPAGPEIVQEASWTGNESDPNDRLGARWRGPYTGTIDGPVELRWWWSAVAPAFTAVGVNVALIADAGTPDQAVLATQTFDVTVGSEPVENVNRVYAKGVVKETLSVQVTTQYVDTGNGARVHYNAADVPSGIGIPVGSYVRPQKQQNALDTTYTGPALEVAAVPIGREAAEPTVGIDSDGVAYMAAGAFDAIPANTPTNLARTEIWRSTDGGKTWSDVQPEAPGGVTTLPPTTLDPYVYVDEDTGRVFTPDLYVACNYLQWSDDQGETWSSSPVACGQPVNDHQTVVTGPPPEGVSVTGSYPNIVYYCFNRVADASCGRSLDGGLTWLPAGEPAFLGVEGSEICGGLHGHIITDNRGYLYVPKGHCGFPWLAISEDAGETWRTVQVNDQFGSAGTHLAVDVDEAGTIYFLWWTAEDRLPLLAYSKDSGESWSAPVLVAPPGVQEVNFPTIDAGKAGQVAISFPGTTNDGSGGPARPWNYYVMTSLNADTASPLFVSTTAQSPADPIHRGACGPGRCAGMFDFIDVEFAPSGEIWAAATDTCTAEADCNTPDGTRAPGADGVAVRQLSGPGLDSTATPPPVARPAPRPVPAPVPAPEPPLPATGLVSWPAWLAAAGVAAGLLGRRRLRSSRV
jgi:hypothetical protein